MIFVKLALYMGKVLALYSDPFADALGEAGRQALGAVTGSRRVAAEDGLGGLGNTGDHLE